NGKTQNKPQENVGLCPSHMIHVQGPYQGNDRGHQDSPSLTQHWIACTHTRNCGVQGYADHGEKGYQPGDTDFRGDEQKLIVHYEDPYESLSVGNETGFCGIFMDHLGSII